MSSTLVALSRPMLRVNRQYMVRCSLMEPNVTSSLLPTYARVHLSFERGEGSWLISANGERYLDFGAGIAVNSVGHLHPHVVAALIAQAQKLWHTSNLFEIPEAETLARRLCALTFADLVFFTNSGAEALEGAIKTARKYHAVSGAPDRYRIVTFEGAFHGRTLATVAAGGNPKYIEGFGPKVDGFDQVPLGDLAALKKAIGPQTAAVLIEPVQGEGGIRVPPPGYLRALREICDAHGLLLIFDEVQCGVGRLGKLFAYETVGVSPDIMAIAKGIGGGFPLGAFLCTKEAGKGMVPGTHGATFGGNPLATTVGNAVLDVILADGFLDRVSKLGLLFKQRLAELKDRHPGVIAEVRGDGLMLGLATRVPVADFAAAAEAEKLIVIPAQENVARILPPLNVSESEVLDGIHRLDRAAARCAAGTRDKPGGVAS
jgi:acetylornithine/N-succinyldiaminopimelate aminotransferase